MITGDNYKLWGLVILDTGECQEIGLTALIVLGKSKMLLCLDAINKQQQSKLAKTAFSWQ